MGSHETTSGTHGHTGAAPLDEPKTPMWLPALGAVLFLALGLFWAICPGQDSAASQSPDTTKAAAPAH